MKFSIKVFVILFLFILSGTIKSKAQMVFGPCGIHCSFEARCYCEGIKISWSTLYEIDSEYFTIERSSNGVQWESIGGMDQGVKVSLGNYLNTKLYYDIIDHNPMIGKTYYRLRQTNFNGEFFLSEPIVINCNSKEICEEIFVPNAFSPNGDGQNDELFIHANDNYLSNSIFVIYDRWGTEIFNSSDIQQGWNGKFREKNLDTGVYTYLLKAILANGIPIEKKGTIALIR